MIRIVALFYVLAIIWASVVGLPPARQQLIKLDRQARGFAFDVIQKRGDRDISSRDRASAYTTGYALVSPLLAAILIVVIPPYLPMMRASRAFQLIPTRLGILGVVITLLCAFSALFSGAYIYFVPEDASILLPWGVAAMSGIAVTVIAGTHENA